MTIRAAITINRPQAEISQRWSEAEPPLNDTEVAFRAAPGGRGTELRVIWDADSPPGGAVGEKVAAVLGADPHRRLQEALRRFKQCLETGEVLQSHPRPEGDD